jgi:hypothetical protein
VAAASCHSGEPARYSLRRVRGHGRRSPPVRDRVRRRQDVRRSVAKEQRMCLPAKPNASICRPASAGALRLSVRTRAFHARKTGSIPVGRAKAEISPEISILTRGIPDDLPIASIGAVTTTPLRRPFHGLKACGVGAAIALQTSCAGPVHGSPGYHRQRRSRSVRSFRRHFCAILTGKIVQV